MARSIPGLRRKRGTWQMFIKINGHFHSEAIDAKPSAAEVRDWRDSQVDNFGGERDVAGGLAARVQEYLERVTAMPTYKQRAAHLALWVAALGTDRPPLSVTCGEIDVVLQGWLEKLEPGTVRKRRTALRSFYAKLYPKKLNPVKGSENPKEPKPEARDLGFPALERAVAAMPELRDTKKGLPPRRNKAKIRARVIAYVGMPPGMLMQVLPHDLVLVGTGSVRGATRRKGGGVETRTVPLSADGLAAFKDFHAEHCYGPFNVQVLNRAFKRGCEKAGLDPKSASIYDARHTFLSQVYRVTRDLATVARLGFHAEGSVITARYAKAANQEVDAAAVAAFNAALETQRQQALKPAAAARAVPRSRRKLPAKVARFRKSA